VGEYLELEDRAQLVNNRTVLIQSMLNMWSGELCEKYVRNAVVVAITEVSLTCVWSGELSGN